MFVLVGEILLAAPCYEHEVKHMNESSRDSDQSIWMHGKDFMRTYTTSPFPNNIQTERIVQRKYVQESKLTRS